jgi:hydrogenase nickel incorporation protein HypB
MDAFRVLEIKRSVLDGNERRAELLRAELRRDGLFLLNLMSSPGAGKTTTLLRAIEALGSELRLGVLEADIDSDVDARTISATGAKVIQLHTGGMCHLDADMTRQGLEGLGAAGLDLVFLENIGNLICTADFDTGSSRNAMILSVPEGDDKPLKYPHMFEVADLVLVNKIDAASFFDFELERFEGRVRRLNPRSTVLPVSAKTGEGMGAWADWLRREVAGWKAGAGRETEPARAPR